MIITRKTSEWKLNSLEELYKDLMSEKARYPLDSVRSNEHWIFFVWNKKYWLELKYVNYTNKWYKFLFGEKITNKDEDSRYTQLEQSQIVSTLEDLKVEVDKLLLKYKITFKTSWLDSDVKETISTSKIIKEDKYTEIKKQLEKELKDFRDDYWSRSSDISTVIRHIETITTKFKDSPKERETLLYTLIDNYREICEESKRRDINDYEAWEDL